MVTEFNHSDTSLNVPKHTGHIARAGDDLSVIDESTARQVTRVSAELSASLGASTIFGLKVVNRADVVKTTTSNEVPGW